MEEFIKIKNLKFLYNKDIILNDISLNISQGELVSIIGPNGSGKSTLIKHLNGILIPVSGEVNVFGYLTTDTENIFNIRKNIAMVFQNPENQIVASIVEEDVAFALENLGYHPNKIREMVDKALKLVGMFTYRQHSTYELSGGQKQRIAIASAIAMTPRCIVFDEATSMLDPTGRKDVIDLIINLSKNLNLTVIFVTHFMEEAILADRLIVMNNGKIEMDGPPAQIFSQPNRLKQIGLALPKQTELCYRLKEEGYNIDKITMTIDDAVRNIEKLLKERN